MEDNLSLYDSFSLIPAASVIVIWRNRLYIFAAASVADFSA